MKSYKKMCESHKEVSKELYEAIGKGEGESSYVVNRVEEGNMNPVTSNAVYNSIHGESRTFTIKITVVNKATSQIIPNIPIIIDDMTQISNESGECTFLDVNFGSHIVKVISEEYEHFIETITVNDFKKTFLIELSIKEAIQHATLAITVTDITTEESINNVLIKIGGQSNITDENGQCEITNLPFGSYIITAISTGYESFTDNIYLDKEVINFDLKMTPQEKEEYIRLTGMVYDQRDVLPDVSVGEKITEKTTATNKNGVYVLDLLKNKIGKKEFKMIFMKEGYNTVTSSTPITPDTTYYTIPDLTLKIVEDKIQDSKITGMAFYIKDGIKYHGKNATIILQSKLTQKEYTVTTDELGKFEASNLSAGFYNAIIKDNIDYSDDLLSDFLLLRPSETMEDVRIQLNRISHDFTLTVINTHYQKGVADLKIEIFDYHDGLVSSGITNDYGVVIFSIPNTLTDILYAKLYLKDKTENYYIGYATDTEHVIELDSE